MNADRWVRIEQLYHVVVSLEGGDRAAFLSHACGDDASLRAEIESLAAESGGVTFLDDSALAAAARLVAGEAPMLTGRMFGSYRIDALIGAGAMGDVYRARDTVLERDVAIKILPEAFADDPNWLARFSQEAQFLASLSHPNVAAIYGMHESDGIRGLVLELIDGETLAERLTRGPLPSYEMLRIARQLGDGLDAAHQRGIVHRDLKPANIKIARDGTTKILDFGLAEAGAGEIGEAVGTASYMSPEQARGDAVDKRTDIWAFGAVCFEMAAGVPAFGTSPRDNNRTVPDWSVIRGRVPAAVIAVLKRCLEEDPKRRRRDIGDVLADIDDALHLPAATSRWHPRLPWMALTAVVLFAVLGLRLAQSARQPTLNPQVTHARTSLLVPGGMDFPERENQIAISSDGTTIAYVAAAAGEAPRLVFRRLDGESEQLVDDAIDVRDPFFSPDGRWIGFIAGGTIRKFSVAEGRSQVVGQVGRAVTASWHEDGILFGEGGDRADSGISRISEDGKTVEVITVPNRDAGETNHTSPQLLPDGRTILYTVRAIEAGGTIFRVVAYSPGKPARVLVDRARFGRYVGDSVLVYQRGSALFATRLDLDTLTTSDPEVMLFNDVLPGRPIWFANGGLLAYRRQSNNRRLVWVDRNGRELSIPAPARLYGAPSLAPSGDRVAVEIEDGGGKYDIWVFDLARQALTQFTNVGTGRYPMWTPDSARIGFAHRRDNAVYWQKTDGTGLQQLVQSQYGSWIGSWTADMRTLVYMLEDRETRTDVWATDLLSNSPPRPLVRTTAREYGGRVSPDGRWVAYFSDEEHLDQFALYLRRLSGGEAVHRVAGAGAREAVWTRSGRELIYRNGRQVLSYAIPRDGNVASGRPVVLFEGDYFSVGGPGIVNFDVSPDGERLLMLKAVEQGRTPNLTVVQDVEHLIRARLPPAGR